MNKRFWASKLGVKLIISVLFSIFCAGAIFGIMSMIERQFYHEKFKDRKYIEESTKKEVLKFQDFISDNKLNSTDIPKVNDWVREKRNIILVMYDGNRIIYDSTIVGFIEAKENDNLSLKHHINLYDVKFNNKDIKIQMICFFEYKYHIIMNYIKLCIAFFCFIFIFLFLIKQRTSYIYQLENEINILEGGNLNYNITVKGNDELAYLAKSIDDMRISVIERQNNEVERMTYNHKLITAMSHDLRTPLTILIGLLEILDGKKYKDVKQMELYINKSLKKSYQIKQLSDKIFEYFLAFNIDDEDLKMESYSGNVINEIIEDYIFSFKEKNFIINFKPINEEIIIFMDIQYIHRVFDNIFSNLLKYSDKDEQIQVISEIKGDYLYIYEINNINKNLENIESTNIGLEICKKIMNQHNGSFYIEKDNDIFKVMIKFKLER